MRFRSFTAMAALGTLAACGGTDGGTTPVRTVATVTVAGTTTPVPSLATGQSTLLTATASDAAGATITNPGIVTWSSGTTTVATVDQSGKVTAVAAGATTISAIAAGVKGTLTITVKAAGSPSKDTVFTISTVAFSPPTLTVSRGASVIFALGFDGIGHDVQFATAPGSPAYIPVMQRTYVPVIFTTAGSFPYTCPTHPQMTGTITVQ